MWTGCAVAADWGDAVDVEFAETGVLGLRGAVGVLGGVAGGC